MNTVWQTKNILQRNHIYRADTDDLVHADCGHLSLVQDVIIYLFHKLPLSLGILPLCTKEVYYYFGALRSSLMQCVLSLLATKCCIVRAHSFHAHCVGLRSWSRSSRGNHCYVGSLCPPTPSRRRRRRQRLWTWPDWSIVHKMWQHFKPFKFAHMLLKFQAMEQFKARTWRNTSINIKPALLTSQ